MAGVADTITVDELSRWASRQAADAARPDLSQPFQRCKVLVVAAVKRRFAEAVGPGGIPWAPLRIRQGRPLRDKGLLAASLSAQVTTSELRYGTNHEHASVHQHGAVIRPVRAKALAVPLTREASQYDSPRDFPRELDMIPRKGKPPLLVEKKTGRGKSERGARSIVHYALVSKVVVPARPFVGWDEPLLAGMDQVFADWWDKKFGGPMR